MRPPDHGPSPRFRDPAVPHVAMCLPLALTIALALAFPVRVAVAHGATSAGEATSRCTRSLTAARWTDGTAPKAREED